MAQPPGELTRVRFTHLDKILYPGIGVTKKEVIGYYIRMAPDMLPYLHGRPVTMHRFPEGIDGEDFYEKDAPAGTPDFVDIFKIYSDTSERDVHFVLCNNLDTLLWLANLASIELHATLSRSNSYESPDFMLFDIDPEPPLTFDDVIDVAHIVKEMLVEHGLNPFVKTSGKKGLHIVVPLIGGYGFAGIRDYAHTVGKAIARKSDLVVSEFPHSRDPGTIFIDYLQNAKGKTMAAPYSLRATPAASVSAPLSWDELNHGIRPEDFNIRTMISRKEKPWEGILRDRQKI
jgi:bifunctional non-homologous end joining protein LigD